MILCLSVGYENRWKGGIGFGPEAGVEVTVGESVANGSSSGITTEVGCSAAYVAGVAVLRGLDVATGATSAFVGYAMGFGAGCSAMWSFG